MESPNQTLNNVATASQVQFPTPLRPLDRIQPVNSKEVGEALELMRETRMEITVLKEIKIMVYKEKSKKS